MDGEERKKQLNIWLSPEARAGLNRFCKQTHGVDVTAFIEALGLDFATREKPGPFRATLEAAKRIHDEHHSRSRRDT